MSKEGQDKIYALVTERMIKALEGGAAPWRKPWTSAYPLSMSTKKPYRGINPLLLAMTAAERGFGSQWWGSLKAIGAAGGQVREEERGNGTVVIFWKRLLVEDGDRVTAGGRPAKKVIPLLRYYRVFNAEQAEGLGERWLRQAGEGAQAPLENAEVIVKEYLAENGPAFGWNGDSAFYSIDRDLISVPRPEQFGEMAEYYSTVFHEMVHSTGHPSRLDIPESGHNHFGDHLYSKEELRAEMGSAMLLGVAGVEGAFENNAAYVAGWLKKLREEPRLVIQAGAQAQRAVDLITGVSFEDGGAEE